MNLDEFKEAMKDAIMPFVLANVNKQSTDEEPTCKEDCYWYGEWQDMNASIPYCKLRKHDLYITWENCLNCPDYHSKNKKTNADAIREMSDKQLSDFLCHTIGKMCNCSLCVAEEYCHEGHTGMIDWLRKEYS